MTDFKPLLSTFCLIIVLIAVLAPLSYAYATSPPLVFYVPAVLEEAGTKKTMLVKCELYIERGNGTVAIETENITLDNLAKLSAEAALILSLLLAGENPWERNFYLKVRADRPIRLTGASWSLSIASAALCSVRGLPMDNSTVATGVFRPDGSVGLVSYAVEKGIGVGQMGFKKFLYPVGQERVYTIKRETVRLGTYVYTELKEVAIPEKFEKINITKYPVGNYLEAVYYFSGNQPEGKIASEYDSSEYKKAVEKAYRVFRKELERELEELFAILAYADQQLVTSDIRRALAGVLSGLNTADTLHKRGKFFGAFELLFQTSLQLYYADYLIRASVSGIDRKLISDIVSETYILGSLYNTTKVDSLSDLFLKAQAAVILNELSYQLTVNRRLVALSSIVPESDFSEYKKSLAESLARSKSMVKKAQFLLLIANAIKGESALSPSELSSAYNKLKYLTNLIYDYAYEYRKKTGVISPLLTYAGNYLSKASKYGNDDYILGIGYLIESYAYSSTYMALFPGFKTLYPVYFDEARSAYYSSKAVIGHKTGTVPIQVFMYAEYGDLHSNYDSAIMAYEKAISYAVFGTVLYHALTAEERTSSEENYVKTSDMKAETPRVASADFALYASVSSLAVFLILIFSRGVGK